MDPFLWGPMASTVQSRTRCPEWRAHPLQHTKSWRSSPWPPCKYHAVALIPTLICRTVAFALFLCSFGDVSLGGNIIQFKHIICKKKSFDYKSYVTPFCYFEFRWCAFCFKYRKGGSREDLSIS